MYWRKRKTGWLALFIFLFCTGLDPFQLLGIFPALILLFVSVPYGLVLCKNTLVFQPKGEIQWMWPFVSNKQTREVLSAENVQLMKLWYPNLMSHTCSYTSSMVSSFKMDWSVGHQISVPCSFSKCNWGPGAQGYSPDLVKKRTLHHQCLRYLIMASRLVDMNIIARCMCSDGELQLITVFCMQRM